MIYVHNKTKAQTHTTSLWFYCELSKTKADEKNQHTSLSHGPDHSVRLSAASPPHKDQNPSHPAPKTTIKHSCTSVCACRVSVKRFRFKRPADYLKWFFFLNVYTRQVHRIYIIHCNTKCKESKRSETLLILNQVDNLFSLKMFLRSGVMFSFFLNWFYVQMLTGSSLPSQVVWLEK